MCFYPPAECRCANLSQRLLSGSDMKGEARKKYTTSLLNDQRNSKELIYAAQKKLGITGPCSTSIFFSGKEIFYWIKVWTDNAEVTTTYFFRKGLVNHSAVSFTVRRELNSFNVISCFMDKTFNTCIELGIVPHPLGWNWLWWILHWTRVIF